MEKHKASPTASETVYSPAAAYSAAAAHPPAAVHLPAAACFPAESDIQNSVP